MATKIATANLQINTFTGNQYVANDYVAQDYVAGGIVAIEPKTSTVLAIAGATITVTGIKLVSASATLSITSTINMGTDVFDIEVNPFNTFIVSQETRVNTIQRETRVKKVKQETRVFELA